MGRRLRVAVGVTLGLGLLALVLVIGGGTLLLRSPAGQAYAQRHVERLIRDALAPEVSLGFYGLRFARLGSVSLDSAVVRDRDGRRAVELRDVTVRYALAPLFDRELHLAEVHIGHVGSDAVQASNGVWNLATLAAAADPRATPPLPWRIRLDTLSISGGWVHLTQPGALPTLPSRQSALNDLGIDLGPSLLRTDGSRGTIALTRFSVVVDAPMLGGRPTAMRLSDGEIRIFADSAQLELPRIAFGTSRLALAGSVGWEPSRDAPRIALLLRADPVHLADVAWANELIPRSGRARAVVQLTDGPSRGALRATVTEFDMSATGSRLHGRLVADMADTIAIRDLDVTASPLDLRLVREILGDSSPPPPWDGALRGRVRASGGPLHQWQLDPSTIVFEDRRVGGAQSRFTLAGTLDLLAEQTTFAPLDVTIDSMDVRTAGGVTAVADDLRGFLEGRVRLCGPLDDLRFTDLDLVHVDGALPRSHVRGDGRIAGDTSKLWLEARLALDTVGVASFGRALSGEVLAGRLHGWLDVRAMGDSVALDLSLSGEGADFLFAGATSRDTARLVVQGDLAVWDLDARRLAPELTLPAHRITAHATLGIDGPRDAPTGSMVVRIDSTSTLAGITLQEGHADLALEPGGIRIDTLALAGPIGRIGARGRLSRDPALRDTLRVTAVLDSVPLLRGLLPDSLAEAWADSLGGRAELSGIALGSLDTLDVRMLITATGIRAGSNSLARLEAEFLLDGVPSATRGLATMSAVDVLASGLPIHSLAVEATVREAAWADASFRMTAGDTLVATARADIHYMGDSLAIRLDSLDAVTTDARWTLQRPGSLFTGPDRIVIDSLDLRSRDGGRFAMTARFETDGPIALRAEAVRVPLAHARFTGLMPSRVNGRLTLDTDLRGTRAAPELRITARLDSTSVGGEVAPELSLEGAYANRAANLMMRGRMLDREAFTLTAELPVDLALEDRARADRLIETPLYVRLAADGSPLAGIAGLIGGVKEIRGGFDADIQVTGTWRSLEPRGILLVRNGSFSVPSLGTGFRDLLVDASLAPDSIIIYRARLADERSPNDSAAVEGAITRTSTGWRADIQTLAHRLRVIDDPRVAEADVSWQLWLRGPLDTLVLGGDVSVPTANVFIGRQQRRVLELEEDRVAAEEASRYAPRLEGLRVRLGNEVRLRSPEANVQLTGEVNVAGSLNEPEVSGEIFAARGTYRLDLGLLQRTFQVDSGLVRMNGPLSIPPTLDIHTSYTVRQAEREDVKINARLTGTVDQPRLTLSSGDLGTTASETEIISYLLFGAPTFVLDGQSASAVRLATAALVPSLGGAAERALGARLPFLSELQVETVAGDSPRDFTLNSFEGLLNSFALTAGTQIGTDSYLRLSGGVCRGENRAAQSLPAWFGISGEYRPRERLSAELSLTPGSAPCNRIGTFAQIYQLGLDLYREWRW